MKGKEKQYTVVYNDGETTISVRNKREAEAYVFGMAESFYITGRHGYFVRLIDEKRKTILERVIR